MTVLQPVGALVAAEVWKHPQLSFRAVGFAGSCVIILSGDGNVFLSL
jgi:hypothetical protein